MHHTAAGGAAASRVIQVAHEVSDSLLHQGRPQRGTHLMACGEHELLEQRRLLDNERALLPIASRDLGEQLFQPAARDRIVGGEIRAAEERGAVGGEEHGERPAAQPGEAFHGGPVSLRDVGPLVAVDADGDEQGVDEGADFRIGIDRAVGFGAPVTVVTPDIKQHGAIEFRGQREGIASPRLPAHRLARRAREVGRCRVGHPVRERPPLTDARRKSGAAHQKHPAHDGKYPVRPRGVPLYSRA